MKTIRLVLSVLSVLLLGAGYAGSQVASINGSSADWIRRVDEPPIVTLALFFLIASLVLAAIRDTGETS